MIHAFTDNSKATWNDYIPDLGNSPQTNRPRLHDELVCVWQRQTETDKDKGREREEEVEMGWFFFSMRREWLVFITMNTGKHIPNPKYVMERGKSLLRSCMHIIKDRDTRRPQSLLHWELALWSLACSKAPLFSVSSFEKWASKISSPNPQEFF